MTTGDIQWDTFQTWREVHASLDHLLQIDPCSKSNVLFLAESIEAQINSLEPVLSELCTQTCPQCFHPCCEKATVRYDLRDLVYLHLLHKGLPLYQPKPEPGLPCYMLGKNGCTLPRYMRPFICTWYLCPQQMELIRSSSRKYLYCLPEQLQEIQKKRKQLEAELLLAFGKGPGRKMTKYRSR